VSTTTSPISYKPNTIVLGDAREALRGFPKNFFDLAITSPPYWNLRDYTQGNPHEIGREPKPEQYILNLLSVFDRVKDCLKDTGSLWVNIADTFRRGPLEIPQEFSRLMRKTRGWHLVNIVIWFKVDAMSESVTRRFSQKYEYFYWFVKDVENYYFNETASKIPVKQSSVARLAHKFNANKGTDVSRMRGMIGDQSDKIDMYLEKGVNAGDLWIIPTNKEKVKHAAPYPIGLVVRPIIACCPPGGRVLDPFMGSGTTALAVLRMGEGREFYGTELNQDSVKEAYDRLGPELQQGSLF